MWGSERGGPIDRIYIGQFIEQHAADVHGRVLEIAGDEYVSRFGRDVRQVDILDVHRATTRERPSSPTSPMPT